MTSKSFREQRAHSRGKVGTDGSANRGFFGEIPTQLNISSSVVTKKGGKGKEKKEIKTYSINLGPLLCTSFLLLSHFSALSSTYICADHLTGMSTWVVGGRGKEGEKRGGKKKGKPAIQFVIVLGPWQKSHTITTLPIMFKLLDNRSSWYAVIGKKKEGRKRKGKGGGMPGHKIW